MNLNIQTFLIKKKTKKDAKNKFKDLFLSNNDYDNYFDFQDSEKADDSTLKDEEEIDDIPPLAPLEGDEEVKEEKGLKILTPNKPLIRLSVLLTKIKAGNNFSELKNKIKQILFLLYQHNKIIRKLYNNLIKSL